MSEFNYADFSTVDYKGQRWYSIESNKAYPSITTILGGTMEPEKKARLENWRTMLGPLVADKTAKKAADRGTVVHSLLEKHLKGEKIDTKGLNPEDVQMFNSLKLRLKSITKIYGQEMALYSDVLGVAGRCDLAGMWKNEEAIIDFKTSNKSKTAKDINDYWLQCTFYALAHNELYGTNINKGVIIMGVSENIPLVFEKELLQFVGPLYDRIQIFYNSL